MSRVKSHGVHPWFLVLAAPALLVLAAELPAAQTSVGTREKHAWGRFPAGSWTRVRKVTEEFDIQGRRTNQSTTETMSTLVELGDDGCKLQTEVTVEVAGKRFTAQPKEVRLGYNGDADGEHATTKKIGTEVFDLGGVKTPCEVLETTIEGHGTKVVSTACYSEHVAPFVLRRETKSLGGTPEEVRQQTTVEVLATDLPYKVLTDTKSVAYIRTLHRHLKGSTYTLEVYCSEVPGGVVAHSSKEIDENGRVVRRSTLELTD